MDFVERILSAPRPPSIDGVDLPRREVAHPSPVTWRDEVVYFLLVDRFSDAGEGSRPLLDRADPGAARPDSPDGEPWRWYRWARSGGERFQGGTLRGVLSKLDYLRGLGATTVWLSPVFKQRGHLDTCHGYGVQDFLEVDPRFGTRQDAVDLVAAAHQRGMRVVFDVIFNHTGANWLYPPGTPGGPQRPDYTPGRYPFGSWYDGDGHESPAVAGPEDGVWPRELQDVEAYTRAGRGHLGRGDPDDPQAEFRRTDFEDLRDLHLDDSRVLTWLARCYKYWIALTDCDGFRIDTVKHVTFDQARDFCGSITEFAANLGKRNFLLLAEVAGGDWIADRYLDAVGRNLDAALDIGEARLALRGLAKGLAPPGGYFSVFTPTGSSPLGSHRELGDKHVSVLDDHDHVFGPKLRFSAGAASDHEVVVGVAVQLLTLGIPCLYYGTEQAFAGPEPSEWRWLPGWGGDDRYLREAMFGPRHPRRSGRAGVPAGPDEPGELDESLPGFGPFGTAGAHCFDPAHPAYLRIADLARVRRELPVLREGRQYLRELSVLGEPFASPAAGEIVAWSRILDDEEALCVLNPHGSQTRGGDVIVDAALNPSGSAVTIVANTAQAGGAGGGRHPVGSSVPVQRHPSGAAFVPIRDLPASEVLVLLNRP